MDARLSEGMAESLAAVGGLDLNLLDRAATIVANTIAEAGLVFAAGNGGSAAQAEHFCAELLGRFRAPRRGLPARSLTADASTLTAIANDFGYAQVFARQLESVGTAGDTVLLISTSGRSENVLAAVRMARELGIHAVSLTGAGPSPLADLSNVAIHVPSANTARIQEAHLVALHLIVERLDEAFRE